MNKNEMISLIQKQSRLTRDDIRYTINSFLKIIEHALKKGEPISLSKFGTFRPIFRKEKNGYNMRTQQAIRIPAHTSVRFRPSKYIKKNLNA